MAQAEKTNVVSIIRSLIADEEGAPMPGDLLLLSPALRVNDRAADIDDVSAAELIEDLVSQIKGTFEEDDLDNQEVETAFGADHPPMSDLTLEFDEDQQPDLPFDRHAGRSADILQLGRPVMVGTEPSKPILKTDDEALRALVRQELNTVLGRLVKSELRKAVRREVARALAEDSRSRLR